MTLTVRRRQPAYVASTVARYRSLVVTTVAVLILVSALAGSLVAGQQRTSAVCPANAPARLAHDGHWLGIRTDPPVAGTMLVHLCIGGTADPVTRWTIGTDQNSTADSDRAPDAVLAVAKQEALAAVAATTDVGRMSVTVQTSSGKLLRFGTAG